MPTFTFETIRFTNGKDYVKVNFLKIYEFEILKEDLNKIAKFTVEGNSISFENVSEESASRKFHDLLFKGFQNLKNLVTKKPATYIHKNSGIPLIGNISFGLLDRGTNIIEVRPISGCNIRCTYCSVNDDARIRDIIVEKDYLVQEFKKLIKIKKPPVEAHIASQGEPTLYADMVPLIKDLRALPEVGTISIDTNATLLNEKFVDELINAGLTRFNLSLNAMNNEVALKIADAPYNHKRILEITKYISTKTNLIIAPVWVPGVNDSEMEEIVKFASTLKNNKFMLKIGIQKFLPYKLGRNPAKEMPWEDFNEKMSGFKRKYGEELFVKFEDFNIEISESMPKIAKKKEIVDAEILADGRLPGEKIAVSKDRVISVFGETKNKKVKIKLFRTKHNIYAGSVVK
ncbi:MAG: radical SAM protein [Nanoarchaeota archaeon]